ncbi:unnamed protein product, partial [Rotaria magnacalcarata]
MQVYWIPGRGIDAGSVSRIPWNFRGYPPVGTDEDSVYWIFI